MKLAKFYELLYCHAVITLKEGHTVIYHGPLNGIPDNFDNRKVIDFKHNNTGFVFYLEAKRQKVKGG